MPQSLSKVFVHINFSTKHRKNQIDNAIKEELFSYLSGICKNLDCLPIAVGGHRNHVHILCILSKKITQVDLLQQLKHGSSIWVKTRGNQYKDFYWQDGYANFSVSPREVDNVASYIRQQEQHHRKISFEDELLELLREHNIDFDQDHLWG